MTISFNEELKGLVQNNPLGLSTSSHNGIPHCIAVAYVKVVSDNQLLITDGHMTTTAENVKNNPAVCLVVWNKEWEQDCFGYVLSGRAEYFTKGKWFDEVSNIAGNSDMEFKGAILVTVEKLKRIV